MEIHERTDEGIPILALAGQFETVSLPTVSRHIEGLIENGTKQLCLNVGDMSFINSTALGYLVEVSKRLKGDGGELVFSEPSKFFAATVRTLELHHIFEVFASDGEAVGYLSADDG